eukprot:TRINITY_DN48161_c0_g1_i1.p2 TRINITY_DN48161_c0_g1~~TRINITY_DN48161_c0_g1_i1.p2  ORF type:complete len:141 (+),score=33.06 TRINITY_DN48161_c0_g1_i1:892-1314(+)
MLQSMENVLGSGVREDGMDAQHMFEKYQDAKIVPVGRGWVNLDCFRIYESAIAGAVPIVVGSQKELAATFSTRYDKDGIIFAENWQAAASDAKQLLADAKQFDARRQHVVDWYCTWLGDAKAVIKEALGSSVKAKVAKAC